MRMGWLTNKGGPQKSKVYDVLERLKAANSFVQSVTVLSSLMQAERLSVQKALPRTQL